MAKPKNDSAFKSDIGRAETVGKGKNYNAHKGKSDSDKVSKKEVGIPESAPPHVKAADRMIDKAHGLPEGSKGDKSIDKAILGIHKKSMAMGKKNSGFKEY